MSTHAGQTSRTRANGEPKASSPRTWTAAERRQAGLPEEHVPGSDTRSKKLVPVGSETEYRFDPHAALDPYFLRHIYGDHQLAAALVGYSLARLREAAAIVRERHPGTEPKDARSKNSLIRYITRMVTSGKYGAEFLPEASGSRAKNGEGARTTASRTSNRTSSRTANRAATNAPTVTPRVRVGEGISEEEYARWNGTRVGSFGYNPHNSENPYYAARLYGSDQLAAYYHSSSLVNLREAARVVQHYNPGTGPATLTRRADLITYITDRVANGTSVAPFAYSPEFARTLSPLTAASRSRSRRR